MSTDRSRLEIFERVDGRYDWRLIGGNGETIVASNQGYENRAEARAMAQRVVVEGAYANAKIDNVEGRKEAL